MPTPPAPDKDGGGAGIPIGGGPPIGGIGGGMIGCDKLGGAGGIGIGGGPPIGKPLAAGGGGGPPIDGIPGGMPSIPGIGIGIGGFSTAVKRDRTNGFGGRW